jgi:hypothetical protein
MSMSLDPIAERYVRLVLAVGQHDPVYVDAYYGDPAWRPVGEPAPLDRLLVEARDIRRALSELRDSDALDGASDEKATYETWLARQRREFLRVQIVAVETRIEMLQGARLSFDEESRRLYDIVAARQDEDQLVTVLEAIERCLPGTGPLIDRYEAHRQAVLVPPDRLARVFEVAIAECRRRTRDEIMLDAGETFTVELVNSQPWTAYNWYQGRSTSVIQVNTDFPMTVDRAVDLACHEGYPGHHVHHSLLEAQLARGRGWVEFAIYPLFAPQSVIAEGTANLGIEIAFTQAERLDFERRVIYPQAGLDPALVDRHAEIRELVGRLHHAGNEAARRYLDGEIDREAAAAWLTRFALTPPALAMQRVRFFDRYRAYVITYNVGLDLVRAWVDRQPETQVHPRTRWRAFTSLLNSPRTPSGLI